MQAENQTQIINNDDASTEPSIREHSVYRFKYSPEFAEKLHTFAKDNEDADAKTFGETWAAWKEANATELESEKQRLRDLGCKSDMDTKMFRSVRYYFRKKGTEKKTPIKRKAYVGLPKGVLMEMDRHIDNHVYGDNFTPAKGHELFLESYKEAVTECFQTLKEKLEDAEIREKIKKTYKNRFFLLRTGHKGSHVREEEKMTEKLDEKKVEKADAAASKKLARSEKQAEKEKKRNEMLAKRQMRKKANAKKEEEAFVKALMRISV